MATQKKRVFISYSHDDRKGADVIAKGLVTQGFNVWYEADEVFPGDNRALLVGQALQTCHRLVVLISPSAMKSPEVRSAIEYALVSLNYEHSLIAVQIKKTAEMPWYLRQLLIKAGRPDDAVEAIAAVLRDMNLRGGRFYERLKVVVTNARRRRATAASQ